MPRQKGVPILELAFASWPEVDRKLWQDAFRVAEDLLTTAWPRISPLRAGNLTETKGKCKNLEPPLFEGGNVRVISRHDAWPF